jgi:NAD(P)H-hydrate repair Nnr-like enzyme with NAD(P)H-hydrate dehydratase domain
MGQSRAAQILKLVREARQPMVIDADGLNILARQNGGP